MKFKPDHHPLAKVAESLSRWTARWIPSSFSIACILTLIAMALAIIFTGATPLSCIKAWGDGFWELLTFAMQMCLIIFTGYIVAVSPPIAKAIDVLASLQKTRTTCVMLVATISMFLAWVNWGLGLIAGAMLVRAIGTRQRNVDYPLLVATAYLGLGCTWHAGLSGSATLLMATPGHFLEKDAGIIPLRDTIFTAFNLGLFALIFVLFCIIAPMLHPRRIMKTPRLTEKNPLSSGKQDKPIPAQRIDHSYILNLIFGIFGLIWIVWYLRTKGLEITFNLVNFIFLSIGILLHRSPSSLLKACEEASGAIHGIVIQFPLYAGILGIIKSTGLADVIAGWFVAISTPSTFPAIVYWYSGILNYFIPSGGSKWVIEAPYLLNAARELGVPGAKVVLSYAWGDMMTNIIQPFWAIPLLGLTGVSFRDILGYEMVIFVIYATVVSIAFLFFI